MVSSGVDSNKDVKPLLTDANGNLYVVITDGTHVLDITAGNKAITSIYGLYPDNTNQMPSMDNVARPGFQKITDGTSTMSFQPYSQDTISAGNHPVVICLNFVKSGANWVPMTQP